MCGSPLTDRAVASNQHQAIGGRGEMGNDQLNQGKTSALGEEAAGGSHTIR